MVAVNVQRANLAGVLTALFYKNPKSMIFPLNIPA